MEEGKWLVSHCSNIEDNKQYYTQLAKEGKFDQLPDTCEFSEAVELEVGDDDVSKNFRIITGKYKGNYMDIDKDAYEMVRERINID